MRKAIFAGAVVLVLSIGTVVLADHGRGWFERGDSTDGELFTYKNSILEEVLADLVSNGALAQVQVDAIMTALGEKQAELVEARKQAKEQLQSFWEDDVLTEDEINQLPSAEHILQMEGVAQALEDGQITRQELAQLRSDGDGGHGRKGSRDHGGKRH